MHLFLTGEIQVGKTTIITKTVELLQMTPGGFKTYFGPDRKLPDRLLYMNSAAEPKVFRAEYAVARFFKAGPPKIFTERFSSYGVDLIRSGRRSSNLIIMDECGSLERDALAFQQAVIEALEGKPPILGVVKLASKGWTDQIRNHPKVQLITVTKENRNALPLILADRIASELNKAGKQK